MVPYQSCSRLSLNSSYLSRFVIIISIFAGLFVILYLTSAQSLSSLVTLYLQKSGFQAVSVKVGEPGLGGIHIHQLSLTSGQTIIDATDIQLDFDWGLIGGRAHTVSVKMLKIQQDQLSPSQSTTSPTLVDLSVLSSLWSQLPLDVASVDGLVILFRQLDLRLEGRARLDQERAVLWLDLNSNLLPAKLEANAVLNRSGKLDVTLGFLGEPPLLEISGNPAFDAGQVNVTGTLNISNQARLIVQEMLIREALFPRELVARFASVVDDVKVKAEFEGRIPWPTGQINSAGKTTSNTTGITAVREQLALQLVAELDVLSTLPNMGTSRIHGPVVVTVADGRLGISSAGVTMNIPSLMLSGQSYYASERSDVELRLDLHVGLDDFGNDTALLFEGSSRLAWNLNLAADSDLVLARTLASSGYVLISKKRGQPIEQMSASTKLTFALQNMARLGVFKHAALSGELEIEIEENSVVIASQGISISVSDFDYNGVPYRFDWVKPAELHFDLSLSRDTLLEVFAESGKTASMGLLMTQLGDEANAVGTVNLNASVFSDDPAAISTFGLLSTQLGFSLSRGQLNLHLSEDTAFEIALESIDVGLKARGPTRVTLDHTTESILMDNSQWIVRVPEVNLLGQRIAFRNALLDLQKLHFQNARLMLNGLLKARSSGAAVPLMFDALVDTNIQAANFTIVVDHQVQQPLLKTELSGWRSPYDLDSGALKLALKGNATHQENTLVIDGTGELSITAGSAHQKDIKMTGLTAAFPFVVAGSKAQLLPGKLDIKALDAGVPVENVQLLIHTDLMAAYVSNLRADMLGAAVQTTDFSYNFAQQSAQFEVQVTQLPVANVLLLEGEAIRGDGILDGNLSVELSSAGIAISEGKLASRAPGGKLAYQGDLPDTNPGLSLAIKALRNFVYRQMEVDVKLVPEGDLNLLVTLQGFSPDVEGGRPINFNLNVSENLPALMESLQASETFSQRIQQRLSN